MFSRMILSASIPLEGEEDSSLGANQAAKRRGKGERNWRESVAVSDKGSAV
jgi:hypothetical protein